MSGDVDRILGIYQLPEEIERFRPDEHRAGRRSESLVRTDHLRVLLVTLREGASLHEHTAPGPITIQILKGRIAVTVERDEIVLSEGGLVAIDSNIRHAVHAHSDGAFLLTIATPGAGATVAADAIE